MAKIVKVCPVCGKEFEVTPKRQVYCSKSCTGKSKFIDLIGRKFGKLTVIKRVEDYRSENGSFATQWLCKCDCGNEIITKGSSLKKGATKSCGCLHSIEIGQKFGKLTVLKFSHIKNHRGYYLCQCECGNQKAIREDSLKGGGTISCGNCNKHHKSNTKIYKVWGSIKSRCFNKTDNGYKWYGGRGITVCQEWLNFKAFYEWAMANGYEDGLSIDRIDVNGNYEPSNCRWATPKEQGRNKRNNRLITFNGETHTLVEWCEILKLDRGLINNRLNNYGWSVERAFTTPPIKHNGKI